MKYKIVTTEDKIIICDGEEQLTGALTALQGRFKKLSEYTLKTKRKKNEAVMLYFTDDQRRRYTERALSLGCRSLQEYVKVLLMADRDLGILIPPSKLTPLPVVGEI